MSPKLKSCKSHKNYNSEIKSLRTRCPPSFHIANSCNMSPTFGMNFHILTSTTEFSSIIPLADPLPGPPPPTNLVRFALSGIYFQHCSKWEGGYQISEILGLRTNTIRFKFLFRELKGSALLPCVLHTHSARDSCPKWNQNLQCCV